MRDLLNRQDVIEAFWKLDIELRPSAIDAITDMLKTLPSAEPEIAENLYLCKCYITDKDGLQHEVIHTGDIRRVTGWEI